MPFIWSSRQTDLGDGAGGVAGLLACAGLAIEVVASVPGATAEAAAANATGEPWRDECPRSRDP
jgi:hypothetical protein